MKREALKTPFLLSVIIIVLASIASAGGLFAAHLYRDNALVQAAWRGNDAVTLVVVIPVMLISLIFSARGSMRAQLVWLGSLGYMFYNYIFYLYGAALNVFFLLYVALVSLSAFALILTLMKTNVEAIAQHFHIRTPVKWIGGFMLFFAVPWSGLEIFRALSIVLIGQLPPDVVATGHPTAVVYATDLSLLMPAMVLGGVLLWQRRASGYLLGAIILFKGITYGLALIAMSVFAKNATGTGDPFTPLYIFLTAGSLLSFGLLFLNFKTTDKSSKKVPTSFNHSLVNE